MCKSSRCSTSRPLSFLGKIVTKKKNASLKQRSRVVAFRVGGNKLLLRLCVSLLGRKAQKRTGKSQLSNLMNHAQTGHNIFLDFCVTPKTPKLLLFAFSH